MTRAAWILTGLVLLAPLALAGCFVSSTPLFTDQDAAAPFPALYMAEVDASGNIKTDSQHQAVALNLVQQGNHYIEQKDKNLTVTFVSVGKSGYIMQDVATQTSGGSEVVAYVLAVVQGSVMTIYVPPDDSRKDFTAALTKAGVTYRDEAPSLSFADRTDLLKALEVFAVQPNAGTQMTFEIATSPSDIASLQQKVALAENAAAPATQAAPVVVTDPGANAPNTCDQQAAMPKDPGRMATGVDMSAIVPALAVQACQSAVAEFPHTARFLYQLGRAEDASNNPEAAVAAYQKAANMGYGMAWYNLGVAYEGDGNLPVDYQAAATDFRNAIAAGIDARSELQELVFDPSGFSNPAFFSAIYEGRLEDIDAKSASVYLGEFMQMFHNTPDCQDVVSTYAMGRLLMGEEFGAIGQMFGGLMQAHSGDDNGDFGQAAEQGWNAGQATTDGLLVQVSDAQADAQLFYNREGCHSPVSRQFFHNIEMFAGGS